MSSRFWLAEERFDKIEPLFSNKPRGVPRVDDRRVLSGIVFWLRRGYRRSDAPAEYGPAKTLYNRDKRRSEAGVRNLGTRTRRSFDAGHVKTHRIAANGVEKTPVAAGPSARPEAGRPRSRIWCAMGRAARFARVRRLATGPLSPRRSQRLAPYVATGRTVVADRGYDANHLRDWLKRAEREPPRPAAQEPQNTDRIRHGPLQNPQHRRAHVQPSQGLAPTVLARSPTLRNIPRRRANRRNPHMALMSLRPRRCHELSHIADATRCMAPRNAVAVLS